ncbi:glutaminase family protein [Lewinella sp. IMCC34191]|uniref:glutaminase family protein n=1 Tax=Lewinella sp. IMCC34191 TaxID=2259172 RepID=UPI000E253DC7|nr:glutaminase family protein [Lewinella sp. IMCC34191]
MRTNILFTLLFRGVLIALLLLASVAGRAQDKLRAPAYPLVTHNPNFSIWSMGDELNTSPTKHWTETNHDLLGLVRVDEKVYRFMGMEPTLYQTILPASDESEQPVAFTLTDPGQNWTSVAYDDAHWQRGAAPFSEDKKQAATLWTTDDLWYRNTFDLEETELHDLLLKLRHDDNVTVYLNGVEIAAINGWQHSYKYLPIPDAATESLTPTGNVLAIHIRNTAGGQWLDAGIVRKVSLPEQAQITKAEQTDLTLTANQTAYTFDCGGVQLRTTFTSPLLIDDLELYARPISYLDVSVEPTDGAAHDVAIYVGASGDIARNMPSQELSTSRGRKDGLNYLRVGTSEQPVLEKKGDDLRVDWGYFYLASAQPQVDLDVTATDASWSNFVRQENFSNSPATGREITLSSVAELGSVTKATSYTLALGYDELSSVNYFGESLEPFYKKESEDFVDLLATAVEEHDKVMGRVEAFDRQLYADALDVGGPKYAELCVLAYRQAIAAHTLVESPEGELLFLSKENNSNGSINTVDVTYPSAPLFLIYNPDLLKGMLNGIFYYSESGKWEKPFPAHDLGTYPVATGQTYGEDMPVEEAGNMIILTAAIADREGTADYAREHWEVLTTWAEFLRESGFDPANQLSTDDFSGHLARNANLSVKAIMGLASYGKLAGMLGDKATEESYTRTAREMARRWMELADDNDHYTLAFGQPGTWSQKYNLVWDDLLDLNIFPDEVAPTEVAYYLQRQNDYGLPLDSRETYTKSDWILWTAAIAEDQDDFTALMEPVWSFVNTTPNRVPLTDWHDTVDARRIGFKARSVVGGYFIKLLKEKY